jgi:cell division protein FtsW (lipid II flippase)
MRAPIEAGHGGGSSMTQQVAIVLIVLVLGASFYMWRTRQLRSRAGLLTIAGILILLVFLAMSSSMNIT